MSVPLFPLLFAVAVAGSARGYRGDGTGVFEGAAAVEISEVVTPRWSIALGSWSNASVVSVGDMLCTTVEPTTLVCVDAATGRERWRGMSEYADTLPPEGRASWKGEVEAAARARTELVEVTRAHSALRREIRRDPARLPELEALQARMAQQAQVIEEVSARTTDADLEDIGFATGTPVTDGEHLFVLFGNGVTSCFTLAGERVWSVWLGPRPGNMRGYHLGTSASPLLVDGLLVVPHAHLAALEPATGKRVWTSVDYRDYGTPAVVTVAGRPWLATPKGEVVRLSDGAVVAEGLGDMWFTGPVASGDRVFYMGGPGTEQLRARGGSSGRAWRILEDGASVRAEPSWTASWPGKDAVYSAAVQLDGRLHVADAKGVLWTFDASTGALLSQLDLQERQLTGEIFAPLIAGSGQLFVMGRGGILVRLQAAETPRELGRMRVGETRSAPVFDIRGDLVVRTLAGVQLLRSTR